MLSQFEQQIEGSAREAAEAGSKILLDNLGKISSGEIEHKAQFDFVTHVDRDSEAAILKILHKAFPTHSFLAEEQGRDSQSSDYLWIIDPLDGTKNYIHAFPFFSISIALKHKNNLIFGMVHDPLRNETFIAHKGNGAFLNNKPIHVSPQEKLNQSFIGTGFPFRMKEQVDAYSQSFATIFKEVAQVRRAGSAALDLAYVACGRTDGFWEIGLNAWDIAAGVLLIEEAGGRVTDFLGGKDYLESGNTIGTNGHCHNFLVNVCSDILA